MAVDVFHGKVANANWDSTDIDQVVSWSCTMNCATADSTSRHDSNSGRTRLAGFKSGTATVTAKANGDFLPTAGAASAVLILERTTTTGDKGFKGTATCIGSSQTVSSADVDETTYEFEWNGTVEDLAV